MTPRGAPKRLRAVAGPGVPAWPWLGGRRGPAMPSLRLGSFCAASSLPNAPPAPLPRARVALPPGRAADTQGARKGSKSFPRAPPGQRGAPGAIPRGRRRGRGQPSPGEPGGRERALPRGHAPPQRVERASLAGRGPGPGCSGALSPARPPGGSSRPAEPTAGGGPAPPPLLRGRENASPSGECLALRSSFHRREALQL